MKVISIFNNKGGVGKTTLTYHLAQSLALMGKKVLMMDLDPQCNLTICSMQEEHLEKIWEEENSYIESYDEAKLKNPNHSELTENTRTIHFCLKPTEEGTAEIEKLPPPLEVNDNLYLLPGRLTLYKYEYKISERWNGAYIGDALSIRTITRIRTLSEQYAKLLDLDFVIIDTSPSLGALNKVIISTVDGFFIPCLPDMFSLYGVRNIGEFLKNWKKELETIYSLISEDKRNVFPPSFVQFLGYTIYNAKKYTTTPDKKWNLAQAALDYARQIPRTIEDYIPEEVRLHLTPEVASEPIGNDAIMYSHNTFPNSSQKYKVPIWAIPDLDNLDQDDISTIKGNRAKYEVTLKQYTDFTNDLLTRIELLDSDRG